eukprot:TRINITY_DN2370_c0_g2_i1.p1 TRINITY_DN2370_c0_g2~~TRINITY_DN2370_c0_g2_i1.p1  ORF type:complete len:1004 (+),score=331.86 TRINITY_DN2370_c0_g2_i1:88-3099(+)
MPSSDHDDRDTSAGARRSRTVNFSFADVPAREPAAAPSAGAADQGSDHPDEEEEEEEAEEHEEEHEEDEEEEEDESSEHSDDEEPSPYEAGALGDTVRTSASRPGAAEMPSVGQFSFPPVASAAPAALDAGDTASLHSELRVRSRPTSAKFPAGSPLPDGLTALHFPPGRDGSRKDSFAENHGMRLSISVSDGMALHMSEEQLEVQKVLQRQRLLAAPCGTMGEGQLDVELLRLIAHNLQLRGMVDSVAALRKEAAERGIDLMLRADVSLAGTVRGGGGAPAAPGRLGPRRSSSRLVRAQAVTGSELQVRVNDIVNCLRCVDADEPQDWPTKNWHRGTIALRNIGCEAGGVPPGFGSESDRSKLRNHVSVYRLIDHLVLDGENVGHYPFKMPIRMPNFTNIFFIMHCEFVSPPHLWALLTRCYTAVQRRQALGHLSQQKTHQTRLRVLRLLTAWVRSCLSDFTTDMLSSACFWAREALHRMDPDDSTELCEAASELYTLLETAAAAPIPRTSPQERLSYPEHERPDSRGQDAGRGGALLSSLAGLDEQEVARQLALLDYEAFASINVREFFNCAWMQSNPDLYQLAINVKHLCGQDGRLCLYGDWVAAQIIQPERLGERREVFRRCVRVAHWCLKLHNYAAARALFAGISHRCVRRMRSTVVGDFDLQPCSNPQYAPRPEDIGRRGPGQLWHFEARDSEDRWWPVTITAEAGVGMWSVEVYDGTPGWKVVTRWAEVHDSNLRRMPRDAKECGDLLPRAPGAEYEMYKALEELADPFRQEGLRHRVDELLGTDQPCIPELSPYLHDFTALSDKQSMSTLTHPETGERCVLVNWPKIERYGETVMRIVAMQRRPFNFTPVPRIRRLLEDLPGIMDEKGLELLSNIREPPLPQGVVPLPAQHPPGARIQIAAVRFAQPPDLDTPPAGTKRCWPRLVGSPRRSPASPALTSSSAAGAGGCWQAPCGRKDPADASGTMTSSSAPSRGRKRGWLDKLRGRRRSSGVEAG